MRDARLGFQYCIQDKVCHCRPQEGVEGGAPLPGDFRLIVCSPHHKCIISVKCLVLLMHQFQKQRLLKAFSQIVEGTRYQQPSFRILMDTFLFIASCDLKITQPCFCMIQSMQNTKWKRLIGSKKQNKIILKICNAYRVSHMYLDYFVRLFSGHWVT